ncbi:glutamate racemase [Pseudomonas sp. HLT2-19-2]
MIGVFDSGLGGLTILSELSKQFKNSEFVYYGDHARAPYGTRTTEEIYEYTRECVARLFLMGCDLVVLACNTASTVALRRLQREWLPLHWKDRRILGIVVPTIEAIADRPWHSEKEIIKTDFDSSVRTIGVFATSATVASRYFPIELAKRDASIQLIQQACPNLAGLIENGIEFSVIKREVEINVRSMMDMLNGAVLEKIVLGCTHYALVEQAFIDAVPPACAVLSQARIASLSLQNYLNQHPQFQGKLTPKPKLTLLTSGNVVLVSELASRFLGEVTKFVSLEAAVICAKKREYD